jgi:hypothetical protein
MMPRWYAAVEVSRRQEFIARTDKLREMIGGSELIARTVEIAKDLCRGTKVEVIWPVSGVVRLASDDFGELASVLAKMRNKLVYESFLPVHIAVHEAAPGEPTWKAFRRLEGLVKERKNGPGGDDGRPSDAYFARCGVQSDLYANKWNVREMDVRRQLLSEASSVRRIESQDYVKRLPSQWSPDASKVGVPESLNELATGEDNAFIALVKADVDGLGSEIADRKFSGDDDARKFCEALNGCLSRSVTAAIVSTAGKERPASVPVIPIVGAGEDIWLACTRAFAFPFSVLLAAEFEEATEQCAIIQKRLTLSVAIVFSKCTYPMDARLRLAATVLRQAKARRQEEVSRGGRAEGYLDYLWLQSTTRPDFEKERPVIKDFNYALYRPMTRPWPIARAKTFWEQAVQFARKGVVPSRKMHQLGEITDRGGSGEVAYAAWLKGLTPKQEHEWLEAVSQFAPDLGRNLWRAGAGAVETPLLEFAELADIAGMSDED